MHFFFIFFISVVTLKLVSQCEPHILIHKEKLRVLGKKNIFEHDFCPSGSIALSPGLKSVDAKARFPMVKESQPPAVLQYHIASQ